MSNVYTEDFRGNAVSVVRAGIPVHALARRLMIPESEFCHSLYYDTPWEAWADRLGGVCRVCRD